VRRRVVLVVVVVLAVTAVLSPSAADIEEQRARLPPPAVCSDPVTGIWMSKKYYPARSAWRAFTLAVRRADATGRLVGEIQNRGWRGGPGDAEPPACAQAGEHWIVQMPAMGTHDRTGEVHFFGTSWRLESAVCGNAPKPGQYSLDHFFGTIDPNLQEFRSLNNDGGSLRNDAAVFRRVLCFEAPPVPPVVPPPPPPPTAPPTSFGGGCGCR
jgi:hypothetical protein